MSPVRSRSSPAFAAGIGALALFIGLGVLVGLDLTDSFDGTVIGAIRSAGLHDLLSPLRVITELGSTWAITGMALVAFVVGVAIGSWRNGVAAALTITLASVANSALKIAIGRARPELLEPIIVEHGYSFPSGHSALGMVAYGVLAVLVSRSPLTRVVRLAIIGALAVLVALIGLSRVWLGVHYPTDVLAGWAAGLVVVVLYADLTRRASPVRGGGAAGEDPAAPRSDRPATG